MASFVALVQKTRSFEWLLFGYSEIFHDNAVRMGKAPRTNKRGFKCLERKMCMIIILDGSEATVGIGYRERVHLYRRWMRETDGFVLILVYGDTVGNEDCRLEDCVIFKGLTYL